MGPKVLLNQPLHGFGQLNYPGVRIIMAGVDLKKSWLSFSMASFKGLRWKQILRYRFWYHYCFCSYCLRPHWPLSFIFSLQFLHFVFILFSILISSEQKSPSILNEFVHYTCLLLTTTFISLVFIRLSQCMFLAVNAKAPVVLIHALVRY